MTRPNACRHYCLSCAKKARTGIGGSDPAVKPKKQIKIVSQHGKEKSSSPITGIGERLKLSTASFHRPKEQSEFF